ncbi:MAG: transglutaminase domain-containing protein [Oscillospiraceae bacterium]|nr:transglutaminase domain-containing protein [Oscillospiraceae bacterium]MBQ9938507.1 transglutaminase domain-containing protein [Oscillospiraceae bacterium]
MVKYSVPSSARLKVQVTGPSGTTYTYNLPAQQWTVFPLSDGSGGYTVKVFQNVTGNKYAVLLSTSLRANLTDQFAPFIRPNQYVNYENAKNTMNKAATLVAGKKNLLDKVAAVYNFVVNNISYDYQKAATVKSGYLPNLDQVLAQKKGICFDYAALMTGMLRSQGIPCKLVVGYVGTAYHAWISVWSSDQGWIDGVIYFNGVAWQRMDPTLASTGGGGGNYTIKYIY